MITYRYSISFSDGHSLAGCIDLEMLTDAVAYVMQLARTGCGARKTDQGVISRRECVCIVLVAAVGEPNERCIFRCYPLEICAPIKGLPEGWVEFNG